MEIRYAGGFAWYSVWELRLQIWMDGWMDG
jgi:hypothetical protein